MPYRLAAASREYCIVHELRRRLTTGQQTVGCYRFSSSSRSSLVCFFWGSTCLLQNGCCVSALAVPRKWSPRGASPFTQDMHVTRLSCRPHRFQDW